LSTHIRLACALCAAGILVPAAGTLATPGDTGGATFSASAAKQEITQKATRPPGRGIRDLGDRVPVRMGMRGRDVRILQGLIRRAGLPVTTDGSFGRQTRAALQRFERNARRPVDGVLDRSDIVALRRIIAEGGFAPAPPPPELPAGSRATVDADGLAAAPADAPPVVKAIIAAGNRIATAPYVYGGGHGRWTDRGYDCSGSMSFALHGAGLLKASLDSTGFERFGEKGYGRWVTIYANGGHSWMMVAGLRFDTSGQASTGSRWQSAGRPVRGYVIRHPAGL